jgi:hypothetical protein
MEKEAVIAHLQDILENLQGREIECACKTCESLIEALKYDLPQNHPAAG